MSRIVLIILIGCFYFQLNANGNKVFISGDFKGLAFKEFASEVKKQTGISIYYKEEWVSGIFITAQGTKINLEELLKTSFKGSGLLFFISNDGVFITKNVPIVMQLPDYKGGTIEEEVNKETDDNGITDVEKIYMEGRKNSIAQTLVVGNKELEFQNKDAVIKGRILDNETGEPLIGATIFIEELAKGSATDVNGYFTISLKPDKYTAIINCLGMKEKHYNLQVYSGATIT